LNTALFSGKKHEKMLSALSKIGRVGVKFGPINLKLCRSCFLS